MKYTEAEKAEARESVGAFNLAAWHLQDVVAAGGDTTEAREAERIAAEAHQKVVARIKAAADKRGAK